MPHPSAVQSLQRAFELIESIVDSPEGLTLQRLAERAELKTTTAFNLAGTLVGLGYLQKTHGRPVRYFPGAALQSLAKRLPPVVEEPFHPSLIRLAAAHPDWRFIVAEAQGADIYGTHVVEPERPDQVVAGQHRWLAPYTTASSLCYLAFCSETERDACEKQYPFSQYGAGYWRTTSRLAQMLRQIQEDGLIMLADVSPARTAAPIFQADGRLMAILGASRPIDGQPSRKEKKFLIEELTRETAAISQRIGGQHHLRPTLPTQPLTV